MGLLADSGPRVPQRALHPAAQRSAPLAAPHVAQHRPVSASRDIYGASTAHRGKRASANYGHEDLESSRAPATPIVDPLWLSKNACTNTNTNKQTSHVHRDNIMNLKEPRYTYGTSGPSCHGRSLLTRVGHRGTHVTHDVSSISNHSNTNISSNISSDITRSTSINRNKNINKRSSAVSISVIFIISIVYVLVILLII